MYLSIVGISMKKNKKGFTLAELLIVVAIIGVLVAIAIPIFTSQLEKSREATDLANVRSAYAQVMVDANLGITDTKITVQLKQKRDYWQSSSNGTVTIGGITHSATGDESTDNWNGNARANGTCEVSFRENTGIFFDWKGGNGSYKYNLKEDLFNALNSSKQLEIVSNNPNFEFDSKCPNSAYVPEIIKAIADDSLLKEGTWAYLGSAKNKSQRYFFWTSFDTSMLGAGRKVPVIIQTGDRKYYVSTTTTEERTSKGQKYITVSEHILNDNGYKAILRSGKEYSSLQEAYEAYEKIVSEDYSKYP